MKTQCWAFALVTLVAACGDDSGPAKADGQPDAARPAAGDAGGSGAQSDGAAPRAAADGGHADDGPDASNGGSTDDAGNVSDAEVASDAALDDAGGDAGAASECAGFKYCEDFESYDGDVADKATLGPWKASVGGGATMKVDGSKPHHGAKALHITVPVGNQANGTLHQSATAGLIPGNNMFGRAMVFYAKTDGNDLPLGVHSWLFQSTGNSTTPAGAVSMNVGGGGAKLQLNYHPPTPRTEESVQGGAMTTGTWHCVQWQWDGAGTPPADTAKVWIDGAVAIDVAKSKGWDFATPWAAMDFGFTHYQMLNNKVEVFLDQFALNDSMIACPPL